MGINIPFFGKNKASSIDNPMVDFISLPNQNTNKEKIYDVLGGMLELGSRGLSNEKTISHKLLEANKEWVYRNNDVIAQEVSKMEFTLYKLGLSKGEIIYNEIEEHPLLDLLDRFNGSTTRTDGIYITQSHKKLTGDAFWLLERNGKTVLDIFILPPDKVELELHPPSVASREGLIAAYIYRDTIDGKSVERRYDPEDIIHFKKPNPNNPFRGIGAVEALAETIDTDNLTSRTQRNFFENGAISNFVLTTDNNVTQEQLKRLRAELRAGYGGAQNAFKAMIFGNGLKPSSISLSNKDLQFLELLEWFRDKIMVCFGNTKASLGIIDDVNRASHDSSFSAWLSGTVKPDMNAIVNTLNEFLVPQFGDKLVLGFKDPVPDDRTDDIEEAVKLKDAGIITINESRELAGYDTIEGGDIFAPAGNITTPSSPQDEDSAQDDSTTDDEGQKRYVLRSKKDKNIPAELAHIDIKHILRIHKMFTERRVNRDLKNASKPMIREMLKKGKNKDTVAIDEIGVPDINPQFSQETLESYYNKQIGIVGGVEEQFNKVAQRYIGEIEREVMEGFNETSTIRTIKRIVKKQFMTSEEREDLIVKAELDFTPLLSQQLALAGQEAFALIGVDDTYNAFNLYDVIRANVRKFAGSMIDTDQEEMTRIIENSVKQGLSVPEMRKLMLEKFADLKGYQADRVTRTEVLRVSNMAAEDAFIQSGVVEAKQWLTAIGADAECIPYNGKIVALRGSFYESDNKFQDGNPPIHPHCRCVLIPIVVGTRAYTPDYKEQADAMSNRISELESQMDKRTKAYKDLKEKHTDDQKYIDSLEVYLGLNDG